MIPFLITVFVLSLIIVPPIHAVCPVCTVAVGAGLGISRFLGIDDSISGIWIGGLILSTGLWLSDWLAKKGIHLPFKRIISVLLVFLFVIPPLYWSRMIGLPGNALWGIDKVLLGVGFGSTLFLFALFLDKLLRKGKNGKVYVHYQKVIIPVFLLFLGSLIFYLLTST